MDSIYWTNDSQLRKSKGHSYFQYLASAISLISLPKTLCTTFFFLADLFRTSVKVLEAL